MDHADFIHLVRLSEQASEHDSAAYRRNVAAFAALGYAWVVGCAVIGLALVAWSGTSLLHGRFRAGFVWALVGGAGLFWTSARALWVRLEPPQGLRVQPRDAPVLFELLERIRRKVKGPAIDEVYLDADFNASIGQRPRWGLFGGARNHLVIGLPMLMALDRQRFLAVLAHEYGHLRGDHGRFAAWIYRTRESWARLHEGLGRDEGLFAASTQAFLRWYFPRFVAKTFAMARQDEYEADRISSRLVGKDATAAALKEIAVKNAWLQERFWPNHWRLAAEGPLPRGPYAEAKVELSLAPPRDFAQRVLREALKQVSGVDDTHPVLRDRLEAIDADTQPPAWSQRPALEMLGDFGPRALAHFDKQWCSANASAWKRQHALLARVRERIRVLRASAASNNADECVELATLERRLDPRAEVSSHHERALQLSAGHAGALRGRVEHAEPTHPARLAWLGELHDQAPAHRWWAASEAVALLEADPAFDDKQLKLWRERRRDAEAAEQRAWEELSTPPFFQSISRHDLGEFELAELVSELSRCEPVARAWLVRKNLKEFAARRCYLLFVELPDLPDEARWDICRGLERWLPLPGPTLALWAGESPTAKDIQRSAGAAIYVKERA